MKVAICIPRHGDTKGEFTISLARMIAFSAAADGPDGERLTIEIFSIASTDLPGNRTRLLEQAILWQADYLLWLDDDHIFPPDTLLRLLRHRLPVVGCNQPRRSYPTGPVAVKLNAVGELEHVWTTQDLAETGAVEPVIHVGLALCLIDMTILPQLRAHIENGVGWAHWAPFARKPIPGSTELMGEDVSFMRELADAGIGVHVDHGLSWQVGHIHEQVLTNADTVAQKQAWLNSLG